MKRKSAKIITFSNQKGGVAKTTTSHIAASILAKRGKRVLVCDLDPQSNLSSVLGFNIDDDDDLEDIADQLDEIFGDDVEQSDEYIEDSEDIEESNDNDEDYIYTLFDVFEGNCNAKDAIVKTESGVDLLPGSIMLSNADRRYSQTGAEYKLKEALEKVKYEYDYIIIDTPPALGLMSLNALATTDYLIVVMTPDYFSGKGLRMLIETVIAVRKYLGNSDLWINGILLTRCDRTNLTEIVVEEITEKAKQIRSKVFRSLIRQTVVIRETQFLESTLYETADNSAVLEDYENFIDELLEEVNR